MKHPMSLPPRDVVAELYDYNPDSGVFMRKKTVSYNAVAGEVAGTPDGKGYLKIGFGGIQYYAHRMAWLMVNGHVPPVMIDHINGNGLDNRISNLRLATRSENAQNQRQAHTGSRTGVLGVYFDERCVSTPYYSKIVSNKKVKRLGYFSTLEEAERAYVAAKKELHNVRHEVRG